MDRGRSGSHIDPLADAMGDHTAPRMHEPGPGPGSERIVRPPPLPSQIDFAIEVLATMPFWIVILVGAALARLTEWSVGKPPQLRCLSLRSSGTPQ